MVYPTNAELFQPGTCLAQRPQNGPTGWITRRDGEPPSGMEPGARREQSQSDPPATEKLELLVKRNGSSSSGAVTNRTSSFTVSSNANTRSRSNSNPRRSNANTLNPASPKTTRTRTHGERNKPTSSLSRARNSSDLRRQRSVKRPAVPMASELTSQTTREGTHFTVGNVGHNGRLYLRYVLSDI